MNKEENGIIADSTIKDNEKNEFEDIWRMHSIAVLEIQAARQSMQSVISWSLLSATIIVGSFSFLKALSSKRYAFLLIGWSLVFGASLLGSSQYVGEINRLLRARFYARKLEILIKRNRLLASLNEEKLWIEYVIENEFKFKYYISGAGALIGLAIAQFSPFLIFLGSKEEPLDARWLLFPILGVLLIMALCTYFTCQFCKQYKHETTEAEI